MFGTPSMSCVFCFDGDKLGLLREGGGGDGFLSSARLGCFWGVVKLGCGGVGYGGLLVGGGALFGRGWRTIGAGVGFWLLGLG